MFLYSFSSFANEFDKSNYPNSLNYIIDEIKSHSEKSFNNIHYSKLTCGEFACAVQVLVNNKAVGGIVFHSKINETNKVSATDVYLYNFSTKKTLVSAVVCLDNSQCSFFNPNQLDLAYEAYKNGRF